MKLLTKEIIKKLPPLNATDGKPNDEKEIIVKFFTPDAQWTWYVLEGEKEGDDWRFFGLVDGFEKELGYFTLNQLLEVRGRFNLPIERDRSFSGRKLSEFI